MEQLLTGSFYFAVICDLYCNAVCFIRFSALDTAGMEMMIYEGSFFGYGPVCFHL